MNWRVKLPKYLPFLIVLLVASFFAFAIVIKAQKRSNLIVEENRFFYWKIYENELLFFRFPSNYFLMKDNKDFVFMKDELRRGKPELKVWFNKEIADKEYVLTATIKDIVFDLMYEEEVNYEDEFKLILESVKIK